MNLIAQVATDFADFWRGPVESLINALNEDKTFDRAVAVIGIAGLIVIGATL
jgi:hypothetical protein